MALVERFELWRCTDGVVVGADGVAVGTDGEGGGGWGITSCVEDGCGDCVGGSRVGGGEVCVEESSEIDMVCVEVSIVSGGAVWLNVGFELPLVLLVKVFELLFVLWEAVFGLRKSLGLG